jgi:hypothetical protein
MPVSPHKVDFVGRLACGDNPSRASAAIGLTPSYGAKLVCDPVVQAMIREQAANLNRVVAHLDRKRISENV